MRTYCTTRDSRPSAPASHSGWQTSGPGQKGEESGKVDSTAHGCSLPEMLGARKKHSVVP